MNAINHPLSCGINILSDVYFFGANTTNGIGGGMIFDIRDAKAFEETIKKIDTTVKVEAGSNYRYIISSGVALGWSSTGAIVAGVQKAEEEGATKKFLDETFNRKESESILANEQFKKFNTTRKDASIFVNGGECYNASIALNQEMSSLFGNSFEKSLKDVYYWGNLDFQNDKILFTTHVERGADNPTKDFMAKEGLCEDHLKCITSKDVYGLLSMHFNTEKIMAYYSSIPKFEESINMAAMTLQVSPAELKSILGGEISIALVDFKAKAPVEEPVVDENDPYASLYNYKTPAQRALEQFPVPVFTVNISANKTVVNKLLEGKLPKNPDGLWQYPISKDYTICMAENKFGYTITNDETLAKNITTGTGLVAAPGIAGDLAKNNPAAFYWDLTYDNYPATLRDAVQNTGGKPAVNTFSSYMKLFKNVTASGKGDDSEFAVNLNSGSGNSLYRLFAQGDEAYKVMKAQVQ